MDFRRSSLALAVAWIALAAAVATAAPPAGGRRAAPTRGQGVDRILTQDNQRRIDVNSVNMWVTNFGSLAYDLGTGNAGLIFPKGTGKTAVFAAGPWIGATVGGNTQVTVGEYSQEYAPGIIKPDHTFDDASKSDYITYKVVRWTGKAADSAHVVRGAEELAADTRLDRLAHHSWSEYMNGAVPYGAPWKWYTLKTAAGADTLVAGPDVLGDQMLWCVYNDQDPSRHTNAAGKSPPLGLEVQQTVFAFNRQGALGNTVFVRYTLINKGTNTLDQTYFSQWADPDLGDATDDLVGCDTTLSLGYVYNANNHDAIYGATPPSVGCDFFLGPKGAGGTVLPLTSFNKYINGTDPTSADETYSYMQGLLPDGSPLTDPDGNVTTYIYAGDPVVGTGWLDSNPADRRFMMSSGPFSMAPGDTQTIVVAFIVGQGNDRLSSISALRFNDTFAQDAFNKGFILPSPPSQPLVDVAVDHSKVTLSWDSASRLDYTEPGYAFEGYNVYQGATVAGPWTRVATYDEIDNIRVIFDKVFDVTTGQLIPEYPVAYGSDAGVQFTHTATQDAVRGGPLDDGTQYYYAVTAYSYDPIGIPKVLENAQQVIRVMPQRAASGTDLATASATPVTLTQVDTAKPPTTDKVYVTVADPSAITGHHYRVTFAPNALPLPKVQGQDVPYYWNLYDVTRGDTLLSHQLNKFDDQDYRVVDGMVVRVVGPYSPAIVDGVYENNVTTHRRAYEGVNWGGAVFGGGADTGFNFWGGTLDTSVPGVVDSFATVELRFSHTATENIYRYLRLTMASDSSTAPPQGREYRYGGFHPSNLQAWDTVHNIQLDMMYTEVTLVDPASPTTILPANRQLATFDSLWAPGADANGSREYLLVLKTPYSSTPRPEYAVDDGLDGNIPILYGLWAKLRSAADVADDGDAFKFVWATPATENDIFDFNTSALVRSNAALSKNKLDRIRVVPNPYYAKSGYELNQFNRVVRFINLPERATIRIFNLAGDLVRTLEKSDPTVSVLDWDLLTRNRLPVGSGVYIYHIDAPGVGSTFGRMAVFMEKERLNNY